MRFKFFLILIIVIQLVLMGAGTNAETFYCPKCGQDVDNDTKFCPQCGMPLEAIFNYIKSYNVYVSSRSKEVIFSPDVFTQPVEEPAAEIRAPVKPELEVPPARVAAPGVSATGAVDEKHGNIDIIMLYDGTKSSDYSSTGRVYLNNKYIGNISVVSSRQTGFGKGYSSNLLNLAGGSLGKRYYQFFKENIPAGTYQVKVELQKKGIIRSITRHKIWKNIEIVPGETTKLFYGWDDRKNFGL